jgi:hypothetical protein
MSVGDTFHTYNVCLPGFWLHYRYQPIKGLDFRGTIHIPVRIWLLHIK